MGYPRVRKLPAIRQTLKDRLDQRRSVVHAVLEGAGVPLARKVSSAPESAMLLFIRAVLDDERRNTRRILALAHAFEVSPFEVAASLRAELPDGHRWLLGVQLHAMDVLAKALTRVEARIASRGLP